MPFFFFTLIIGCIPYFTWGLEQLALQDLCRFSQSAIEEIGLGQIPKELQGYQLQEVWIRGFLYGNTNGQIVLAKEPNLKSCCVAKPKTVMQQVIVEGIKEIPSHGRVVKVQGVFKIDPVKDEEGNLQRVFVLQHAALVD